MLVWASARGGIQAPTRAASRILFIVSPWFDNHTTNLQFAGVKPYSRPSVAQITLGLDATRADLVAQARPCGIAETGASPASNQNEWLTPRSYELTVGVAASAPVVTLTMSFLRDASTYR